MENKLTISGTIKLSDIQVTLICLILMGFNQNQLVCFTGFSKDTIKKYCSILYALFDAPDCLRLAYQAQLTGFDINGCYKGKNMLTHYERDKIAKGYKWVKLPPAA
jgi:hypothetical protein